MMDRRLRLAKRLLRPDGVLIVTIDEHEVHHLGMLLESIFPSYLRHMITIMINPKGTGKLNFGRVDEYALFCVPNLGRSIILGAAKAKVGTDLLDAAEGEEPDDEDDDESVVDNGDDEEDEDAIEDPSEEAWPHPFPREEMDMWELRHARRRGSESGYVRLIRGLKATEWRVELIYLALPTPEMAKLRVAERVSHGGHDIPVPDIERRFVRSWENLMGVYASLVDRTVCLLNSGDTPEIVFTQQGEHREVMQPAVMRALQNREQS